MKKTLIIDNIITPYAIFRYNAINKALNSQLEVWFQAESDINRDWKIPPQIDFKYKVLKDYPLRFIIKDFFTFHLNPEIFKLLPIYKKKLGRVICHGWDSPTYLYALLFCIKNKIRCTVWSGSTLYEKKLLRYLFNPLLKLWLKLADDFIAYGSRAKKYLESLGVEEDKIKIFLNTVDVDFFSRRANLLGTKRNILRKKYGFNDREKIILFVGQLIERKGIVELIEAFAEIAKSQSNIALFIIGNGPLRDKIKDLIKQYAWAKIKHIDFIQYDKMPEVYAVSDVLVLPSKEEVWGLVVNEALSSGIPVMVSHFTGVSDDLVIGRNGMVINNVSEEEIRMSLLYFLDNKNFKVSKEILDKMRIGSYIKDNFS